MRCRELFAFLRALKGINVIGGEVNEFTPEYDSNEVTAHACAQGAWLWTMWRIPQIRLANRGQSDTKRKSYLLIYIHLYILYILILLSLYNKGDKLIIMCHLF